MRGYSIFFVGVFSAVLSACAATNGPEMPAVGAHARDADRRPTLAGAACNISRQFPVAAPYSAEAIGALTADDAWAAGVDYLDDTLWVAQYKGGAITAYTPAGPQWMNLSFFPISDTDVWVAGSAYAVGAYVLHWDGTSWTRVQVDPSTVTIGSVTGRAANDVWFAGTNSNGKLVLEHWDGQSIRLVGTGPYGVNGGAPDILELSQTNVWILVDGQVNNGIGVEVVNWNGSRFSFHILPSYGVPASTASLGVQLAATSPTNVWAIGSASIPGSTVNYGQIWRYDGNWQPYAYTGATNNTFQGVAALRPNDAVITAITPTFAPSILVYQNATRWHPESNSLGNFPIGKVSAVRGTSSFWTVLTNGDGSGTAGALVTCP